MKPYEATEDAEPPRGEAAATTAAAAAATTNSAAWVAIAAADAVDCPPRL